MIDPQSEYHVVMAELKKAYVRAIEEAYRKGVHAINEAYRKGYDDGFKDHDHIVAVGQKRKVKP